ncbi:MAG: hypothetical protein QOD91_2353 [Frankiales bacterium]|nr:hypothetical protein [Frankiales bacterium]
MGGRWPTGEWYGRSAQGTAPAATAADSYLADGTADAGSADVAAVVVGDAGTVATAETEGVPAATWVAAGAEAQPPISNNTTSPAERMPRRRRSAGTGCPGRQRFGPPIAELSERVPQVPATPRLA